MVHNAPMLRELSQTIRSAESTTPKTILGYCALVLGIAAFACVAAAGVLAQEPALHRYIPWVLGFFALAFFGTVGCVIAITLKDPTKLQLGQVTGRDYIENRRLTLGDSTRGERRDSPAILDGSVVEGETADTDAAIGLPSPESTEIGMPRE